MKITTSSDWRSAIPFDTPVLVADVVPGEPTRCSACGTDSELRPRTELWAIKHRHPNDHAGYVRFYCRAHLPVVVRAGSADARSGRTPARSERRPAAKRRTPVVEKERALCPDCFVEIPPTGICGMCGRPAA